MVDHNTNVFTHPRRVILPSLWRPNPRGIVRIAVGKGNPENASLCVCLFMLVVHLLCSLYFCLNVRKAVGVLIQSCWHTFLTSRVGWGGRGVSQHFADVCDTFSLKQAKSRIRVRYAKCINATMFSLENKLHIYSFAHDFVRLRERESRTQRSVITF